MELRSEIKAVSRARSGNNLYCCVVLVVAIALVAAVRFHVRNMPLERDEGEYAYVGQLMLHGVPPYRLAANMKLPGTYAAYAATMAMFGQTAAGIHVGMILVTTLAAILLFLVGKYLYGTLTGAVAGAAYIFLAARPGVMGIDAHATHFVVLFVLLGILLLLYACDGRRTLLFFVSGLAFGLSFLMKQPGILFAVFGGAYWLQREWKLGPLRRNIGRHGGAFLAGVALPYALTCLLLLWVGVFHTFWFWTWDYARAYGSINGWSEGWHNLTIALPWAVRPFVLWELVVIGVAAPLWSRYARTHGGFVAGFLLISALAVCPGFYFRPHYFIVLLPATALCIGVAVECAEQELTLRGRAALASLPLLYFVIALAASMAGQWKTFSHLGPEALSRKIHAGEPYADAVPAANFIRGHARPQDQIGMLGSEPEICFYTRLRCASSYLYMYPLMERQRFAQQMQNDLLHEIGAARPRFLVYVDQERSWGWKPTLGENRAFLDRAWDLAQRDYTLIGELPASDIAGPLEHLRGERAQFYIFQRK